MKRKAIAVVTGLVLAVAGQAEAKPLKVFILAGQSNMEGPASIKTFDYIGDDPKTAPMLKEMVGPDGKPVVCDRVWMSYLTGDNVELCGKLTAGFGSLYGLDSTKPGDKIGPEFTFGLYMEKALHEPILIIKTAWGGKSLCSDFRPPSAHPRVFIDYINQKWKERGVDPIKEAERHNREYVGVYYQMIIAHVKRVLVNIPRVMPTYDPKQGYELAGFVWLQGFNDLVDGWSYPKENDPNQFAEYSELLSKFIRDVRADLVAPNMPFVIGVAGFEGMNAPLKVRTFRRAMAAPASLPEFKGNVVAVETAPFWAEELAALQARQEKKETLTPAESKLLERGASNAGFHYLGCAKTFALMGKAFAEALVNLQTSQEQEKQ